MSDDIRRQSNGIEYRLVEWQEPLLYVIRKLRLEGGQVSEPARLLVELCTKRRSYPVSQQEPAVLASFYILDGTIYPVPTVEQLVMSRLVRW